MKTLTRLLCQCISFVCILCLSTSNIQAQSHVSLSMDNCAVVANNEVQFDINVVNDGTTSLKFNSVVIRFLHNANITSGGTISWGLVPGSSSLPNNWPGTSNYGYNASTRISTYSSNPTFFTASTAPSLPYGVPVKIGRYFFKVTGGTFNTGVSVGLTWNTGGPPAGISAYEGTNTLGTSFQYPPLITQVPTCTIIIPSFVNCSSSLQVTTTNVSTLCASDGSASVSLNPLPQSVGGTYTLDGGSPINYTSQPLQVTGLTAGPHQLVVNNGTCLALSTTLNIGGPGSTVYTISNPTPIQCDTNLSITLDNAPANTSGTYTINGGLAMTFSSNPFFISTNNVSSISLQVHPNCNLSSSKNIFFNVDYITVNSITSSTNCMNGSAQFNFNYGYVASSGQYRINNGNWQNYTTLPFTVNTLSGGTNIIEIAPMGCSRLYSKTFTVPGLGNSLVITKTGTCPSTNTGTASINYYSSVSATTGTYQLDGGSLVNYTTLPIQITGLSLGSHTLVVNNAASCPVSITNVFAIDTATNPLVFQNIVGACNSTTSGSVTVNFTNIPSFTSGNYKVDNGPWVAFTSIPFTISGLTSGQKNITIQNTCPISKGTVTIPSLGGNSLIVSKTSTCPSSNAGTASINFVQTVTSTTGSYQLDGGSLVNYTTLPIQLTGLSLGSHTIAVNSTNGCATTLTNVFTIDTTTNPLVFQNIVGTCFSNSAGSVDVNFTNTPSFTSGNYKVDNGPWVAFTSIPFTVSGLNVGQRTITIQNTCPISKGSVSIPNTVANPYTYLSFSNYISPTCYGGNNGSVSVTLVGNPSVTIGNYILDGGLPTPFTSFPFTINGLTAGNHTVTLQNVCLNAPSYYFNLQGPNPISNNTYKSACTSYTWPLSGSTYTVTGTYSYVTTNSNGCTVTDYLYLVITNNTLTNTAILPSSSPNLCISNMQNTGNMMYGSPNCELAAQINSNSSLGNTQVCVSFLNNPTWNTEPYANRVYSINPSFQPVGGAIVKLYYSGADLNSANINGPSQFSITKISGNGLLGGSGAVEEITNSMMTITLLNSGSGYYEVSFPVTSFSTFYLHSKNYGNGVLPVSYLDFTGKKIGEADLIEWTTATEENNAYFNLQYSTDAINFKTIERIETKHVAGNAMNLDYAYTNTATSNGHNYYRLEQVDIDGKHSLHSKVIDVWRSTAGHEVSIYPNPANQLVHVDFYTEKVGNAQVKLTDVSGRVVKQLQAKSVQGLNQLELGLESVAPGVYRVQVFMNSQLLQTSSLVKSKE